MLSTFVRMHGHAPRHSTARSHGTSRIHRAASLWTTLVVAGLLLAGFASPAGARSATPCKRPYVAVDNDSWSRIADKTGVTLKALLSINSATTKSMILVGDTVCLPKGTTWNQPDSEKSGLHLTQPKKTYSVRQAAAAIKEVFPTRLEAKALAIARRESHLNPANWSWCCVGLFQINWWAHKSWLADMGITKASQLFDPKTNARAALAMYKRSGGWSPWDL